MISNSGLTHWREMDGLRAEPDPMFRQASADGRLLPAGGMGDCMLPAILGVGSSVWTYGTMKWM